MPSPRSAAALLSLAFVLGANAPAWSERPEAREPGAWLRAEASGAGGAWLRPEAPRDLHGFEREGLTLHRPEPARAPVRTLVLRAPEPSPLRLLARAPFGLDRGLEDLQRGRTRTPAARAVLAALGAVVLLAALLARLGRRATVHVRIEYPAPLRGTFCVSLHRRSDARRRRPRLATPLEAERARSAAGGSGPTAHFGIARETLFLAVPCRRWFVTVDGFVQTAESQDVFSSHFAEREVQLRSGETLELCFRFEPRACPVELRVVWDGAAVETAQVARYGVPESMRFARGAVQFSLDRGRHVLVAGATDRVAELALVVESTDPQSHVLDLGDRSQLVFTGCPRAVGPYLHGDVPSAARALENDGQSRVANLLLARFHRAAERWTEAAQHFALAGEALAAAELYQSLGEDRTAAELYEQAEEDERAGERYRAAGDPVRAGEAFLRAEAWEAAAACFREAGDLPRWRETLTKLGRHFAAAKAAIEQGDRSQAIQCLRRVGPRDADYPDASVLLAEAYQREGHADLARSALEDLLASRAEAEVPCEAFDRLARLCEQGGDVQRALGLLETLRLREPTWPHVATRVDALRKRRGAQTTLPDDSAPTLVTQGWDEGSRYEILEELGRGGMGVVFRARDRRLGREVALKRLPDHIRNHPKAVELFLREARAAASLNHPNIVTVYDAGQEGDGFTMTMELLQGQPLQKLLKSRGRLAPGLVVKLGGQAARGLQYAHEQGIVHRDVKTANLFFTDKKVVKIMDFGLAKMVEEVRRSTTVIGGTPYYMAPEQSAGEQVDHRSDLYALGITLYELLAGRVPFRDGDVAFHHRHSAPPDLQERAPDVPDALARLVRDLLAKRPADRVRSAGEVVRRLAEIARGF